jgi:four helix bundle protein
MQKLLADSLQLADKKKIQSFKELLVWQRAMELAREIYTITKKFPASEQYGLVSQMRRCAVSVPSNIAEGEKRGTRKDFVQFLRIADGSASELETQLILVSDIYPQIGVTVSLALLSEVQKMLGAMIIKLSAVSYKP